MNDRHTTIAIFGGSFNPPTCMHQQVATVLAAQFTRVLVVPCGPRPDKQSVNEIASGHRARMAELAFSKIGNVLVDTFDLACKEFTRAWQLEARYQARGEVWHVVGADLCEGGGSGASQIQRLWERGSWIWQHLRFAIVARPGYRLSLSDAPPHSRLIELASEGSSTGMRERLGQNQSVSGLIPAAVEAYIAEYGLYEPQTEG